MKTNVLITVKTYPTLSHAYGELVCTAGITDEGRFIRIYPIPFRKLEYDKRYQKYQWINFDLERNPKDPRPESHRLKNIENIVLGEVIDTDKGTWTRRKELIFMKRKPFTNLSALIAEAKDDNLRTSLAIFKPAKVHNFVIEEVEREWDKEKLDILKSQGDLFDEPFTFVRKLPYKFSYRFEDDAGNEATLMNEDWEIGQLYWNCLKQTEGNEAKACELVRKKYWDDFVLTKDLHLFLGTTQQFHFVAPNPFIIIGTFTPKKLDADLFSM